MSELDSRPVAAPARPASAPRAWMLAGPAVVLGIALALFARWLPAFWTRLESKDPELFGALFADGMAFQVNVVSVYFGFTAVLLFIVGLCGLKLRHPLIRSLLRKGYGLVPLGFILVVIVLDHFSSVVLNQSLTIDGAPQDRVTLFFIQWNFLWPLIPAVLLALWAHVQNLRAGAVLFYGGSLQSGKFTWSDPVVGDRIMENLRVNGKDARYRKSSYGSMATHLGIIVILPVLVQMFGCVERYRIPEGSGEPLAAVVQVVKREVPEQDRLILRPEAAIIFERPELDDSKLLEEMMETTMLTYEADTQAIAGRVGAGGGKEGGWPDGMEDGTVRFIRLEYDGPGWDNAMGPGEDSDINFLRTFGRLTGLRVSNRNESHGIRNLSRYARGYAPPFVFMTGHGHIRLASADTQVLRQYLNDGGMLFASAGSAPWHREFVNLMRALYPEENLRTISDDDPIFQMPYYFPNGAPPLWHHGGRQAMGIRKDGRWVVFYHPGDIQDAWRTDHSGLSPELAEHAAQMGVNIIYYAFTQYLELTKDARK